MSLFVSVVEAGSLSGASRKLGMPLPTVSRKVAELETHLTTRLLIRSTRKLALTDAGAAYLTKAKRILELVGEAERSAAGEYSAPRGELVITAPVVFGSLHVLPVVDEFLTRFAEIDVRLMLSDRNFRFIDDHIDVALRIGALPDSSTVSTRVGQVRRVVCGSPAYFAERGTPKSPDDLAALACINFDFPSPSTAWGFPAARGRGEQWVPIRARLSVNTAEAAIDAAIAGVGVTRVLSYQIAEPIAEKKLQIVLSGFEPPPMPVHILYAEQAPQPLKLRSFLDFAIPQLRERLARSARVVRPP